MLESKNRLLTFFNKALTNCSAKNLIQKSLHLKNNKLTVGQSFFNLNNYNNIYILGSGKASTEMALGLSEILKTKVKNIVVVSNSNTNTLKNIEVLKASHPVPNLTSFKATKKLISHCKKIKANDFFIFLLSGGSSAMVELPVSNFSHKEIQTLYKQLLTSGMDIEEINTVRNCFSKIKGGGLLQFINGNGICLVLSDVLSDNFKFIGSGPLFYTKKEYQKAQNLIKKHNLKLSSKFLNYLQKQNKWKKQTGNKKQIPHFIVGNNQTLLTEIKTQIEKQGFPCHTFPNYLKGEASTTGEKIAKFLLEKSKTVKKTTFFLFGGETTVKVKGNGVGGRNQELALTALKHLKNCNSIELLSIATDGIDGNSCAAGAFINFEVYEKAINLNLDINKYLKNNDSYNFFKQTDSVIITGKTNNNLLDVVIARVGHW